MAALLAASTLSPPPLMGQSSDSGVLAFLVQDGLRYTEERRYREAINVLEEAWERDPSNPIVAEHLALSYLYEDIPPAAEAVSRARELMSFSLQNGGQASFFSHHLHSKLGNVVNTDDYCFGRLALTPSGVHHRTSLSEHSFSLSSQELKSVVPPKSRKTGSAGGLILHVKDGKRHRIRTGTRSRSEAEIVLQLIREFVQGG